MAKKTLETYPREFLDVWTLVSEGKLSLPFISQPKAKNFKTRLYAWRKRYLEANPVEGQKFYELDIADPVQGQDGQWYLTEEIVPWKKAVREARGQAVNPARGVTPVTLPQGVTMFPEPLAVEMPAPSNVDHALAKLGFGTKGE